MGHKRVDKGSVMRITDARISQYGAVIALYDGERCLETLTVPKTGDRIKQVLIAEQTVRLIKAGIKANAHKDDQSSDRDSGPHNG